MSRSCPKQSVLIAADINGQTYRCVDPSRLVNVNSSKVIEASARARSKGRINLGWRVDEALNSLDVLFALSLG